jgi:hypothetical protein
MSRHSHHTGAGAVFYGNGSGYVFEISDPCFTHTSGDRQGYHTYISKMENQFPGFHWFSLVFTGFHWFSLVFGFLETCNSETLKAGLI